ncbi:MAG: YibE/F family protein [Treponemataceae bacterium]
MINLKNINRKELIITLFFISMILILFFVPTGFQKQLYVNSEGIKAKVLEVDNSRLYKTGLITQGEQTAKLKILTGSHKGEIVQGMNLFSGKISEDKIYQKGDLVWSIIEQDKDNKIVFTNIIDYYRIGKEIVLFLCFSVFIFIVSGFTGFRTILSFMFTLLCIWKIIIPFTLKGYPPLLISLGTGNLIAISTILLVAGFQRYSYVAILSSCIASLFTGVVAIIMTHYFKIDGSIMEASESILYSGFLQLNLTQIFQGSVYLASSGAILDLSIDISAALEEVVFHTPQISRKNLFASGMRIGRAVVGTQTTTLLLAYMGSYLSIMMVFMAQGTNFINILTSQKISSEILHTFVGCIGLVAVSPLTSLMFTLSHKPKEE